MDARIIALHMDGSTHEVACIVREDVEQDGLCMVCNCVGRHPCAGIQA